MASVIRRTIFVLISCFAVACGNCGEETSKRDPDDAGLDAATSTDAGADSDPGPSDAGGDASNNGAADMGLPDDGTPPDLGGEDVGGIDVGDDMGGDDMPVGRCGNAIVEGAEECDDGDMDDDDECKSDCTLSCGDGTLGANEACDIAIPAGMPGACPTACDDGDACTTDSLQGADCDATCVTGTISACTDDDGCCPSACNANNDNDCAPVCGNMVVEGTEVCDGNCPAADCDDNVACTTDVVTAGSAATCDLVCSNAAITMCIDGDGCCPAMCDANNDDDCSATCGNNTVEGNETCDGNCPTSCDDMDFCTADTLTGSAMQCNAECNYAPVTQCRPNLNDGCCPMGCTTMTDADCTAVCGNGTIEPGEQCDDMNTMPGDGCDGSCQLEVIAYRLSDLDIKDPHIYADLPFFGCRDITNNVPLNLSPSVNDMLEDAIRCDGDCGDAGDDDGFLDLSFVLSFSSLNQGNGGTGMVTVAEADCTAPEMGTSCTNAGGTTQTTTYTSQSSGDCLDILMGTVRPYTPAVALPSAPCFGTDAVSLTLDVSGIIIPLTDVRVGATYVGNPATGFSDGLLRGFLSEAAADMIIIPDTIAVVGGERLSSLLPGGMDNCANHSDLDVGPDGMTPGWWFYLNFPATRVPYVP